MNPTTIFVTYNTQNEFEQTLAIRLNPEQGFFRLCTSYDSFTLVVVDGFKGMDKGDRGRLSERGG